MTAPIIQTPDFTLRPFQASDASALASGIAEWDVIRMLTTPPYPYSKQDAVDHIERVKDDPWHWVIDIDGVAGSIAIDEKLGYWLAEPSWGHGIMTRAAQLVLDRWFSVTDADQIFSGHFRDNVASGRVLTKLGFVETGRAQVHAHSRGGTDESVRMVLTRADWKRRRAA